VNDIKRRFGVITIGAALSVSVLVGCTPDHSNNSASSQVTAGVSGSKYKSIKPCGVEGDSEEEAASKVKKGKVKGTDSEKVSNQPQAPTVLPAVPASTSTAQVQAKATGQSESERERKEELDREAAKGDSKEQQRERKERQQEAKQNDCLAAPIDQAGNGTNPDGDIAISPNKYLTVQNGSLTFGNKNTRGTDVSWRQFFLNQGAPSTINGVANAYGIYDVTVQYMTYGTTSASSGGRFVIAGAGDRTQGDQWNWIFVSKQEDPGLGFNFYRFKNLGQREGNSGNDKWSMQANKQSIIYQTNGACCSTLGWDIFSTAALSNGSIPNDTDISALGGASLHQQQFVLPDNMVENPKTHLPEHQQSSSSYMPANPVGYQANNTAAAHYIHVDYTTGYVTHSYFNGNAGSVVYTPAINIGQPANFVDQGGLNLAKGPGGVAYYMGLLDNDVTDAKVFINAQAHVIVLWTGHQGCVSDNSRTCAYVGKYDLTGDGPTPETGTHTFFNTVYESAGANMFMPAITPNSAGDAFVFYSNIPLNGAAGAAVMAPTFNSLASPGLRTLPFQDGNDADTDPDNLRWGDYNGAGFDPSPNNGIFVYGIADRDNTAATLPNGQAGATWTKMMIAATINGSL
jgi:hypothetical protein